MNMAIAASNVSIAPLFRTLKAVPAHALNRLGSFWKDYRRSMMRTSAAYYRSPMACHVPLRVWRRHSAMLLLMENSTDRN